MQELNWKKDLNASLDIIENTESVIGDAYQHYARIFNISDVNHYDLFTKLKTDKKSYLGVAGSTVPMLNVASLGYKKITVFDINALNIHFMFLKISAVLALDYEEYLYFFYSSATEKYFSKKYFQKLKVELPYESLEYWKGIYENCNIDRFNDLFYSGKFTLTDYEIFRKVTIPSNIFLVEQAFYTLKSQLKQIKLIYFIEDFGKIPNLIKSDSISLIYLANMQNYIYDNVQGYNYLMKLKEYENLLNNAGLLQGGFIHWFHYEDSPKWFNAVIDQFEKHGFSRQNIDHVPGTNKLQDIALIKRKNKET